MEETLNLEIIHNNYKKLTQWLISHKKSITTMESCTSGFIASLITDSEGASAIIKGACITYSNEAKILNGVSEKIIAENGVYSLETAQEMAQAILKIYPSDISIGITGTFGNVDPNNADSVPGKVFIAIKNGDDFFPKEIELPKNITRFESKLYVAQTVYTLLSDLLF